MFEEPYNSRVDENIPYLRRYPLSISNPQYDMILTKISSGNVLTSEDLELIKHIIANAKFWKEKYGDLNRKIWAIAEDNHERI